MKSKKAFFSLLLVLLVFPEGWGQQRGVRLETRNGETAANKATKERLALIIGNWKYVGNSLVNPENDARAMKKALENLGFDIIYRENIGIEEFEKAVIDFSARLKDYQVGMFYFAGHGFESRAKINYLMSTDVRPNTNEVLARDKSMSLDLVLESMHEARNPTNILIIDACRNNPFRSWARSEGGGLGAINAPEGTIVFFAASPGQAADENPTGKNGLFTQELLKQLDTPDLELSQILKNTSREVKRINGWQVPYYSGQILGDFYFKRSSNAPVRKSEPVATKAVDIQTLKMQAARYKKRKLLGYGVAAGAAVLGTITYLVANGKYNSYVNEVSTRNADYRKWYAENFTGQLPPTDDMIVPLSKSSYAGTAIASTGVAVAGGVAMLLTGAYNARRYRLADAEIRKRANTLSVTPLLHGPQRWAGLALVWHF